MDKELDQRQALLKAIDKAFGKDCIIVHKPEGLDYYITTSSLAPSRTKDVIRELNKRL